MCPWTLARSWEHLFSFSLFLFPFSLFLLFFWVSLDVFVIAGNTFFCFPLFFFFLLNFHLFSLPLPPVGTLEWTLLGAPGLTTRCKDATREEKPPLGRRVCVTLEITGILLECTAWFLIPWTAGGRSTIASLLPTKTLATGGDTRPDQSGVPAVLQEQIPHGPCFN